MLRGIRFPSDGYIGPRHIPDTPLSKRLVDGLRACPWAICGSDRYGEHAEQFQEFQQAPSVTSVAGALRWENIAQLNSQ